MLHLCYIYVKYYYSCTNYFLFGTFAFFPPHINISLFLGKLFSDPCNPPDHRLDIDGVHERAPRVPIYVRTYARVHAFNGYLYTNKRTVHYTRARALAARTYTRTDPVGRQKDQMCVGTGGRGSRRKGREGKRRTKEEGKAENRRRRQKNTHRRCSVRSEATGTLLSVTNSFFLSLFSLLFLPPSSFPARPWCMVATC